ncbi:MAG: MerC domain-containing protein [Candidatus Marinimicrobia bacterium]|nr:MerC domain-containing protein [Candidatus Neomarinimicrobiota bacterium]
MQKNGNHNLLKLTLYKILRIKYYCFMKNALNINLDNVAISFSVLCGLHCLLLPIAIIFFPAISATFMGSEDFHKTLLYFIIPSSIIAMTVGCKMHGKYNVYLYGIIGVGTLLIASFFGHDYFGESGEIILTLIGTGIVSYGHLKNQRLCAECCK